jgi:hypothetical protein
MQMQQQHQQQQQQSQQQQGLLSPELNFADLDSPTMSLPSPGCSLDGTTGSLSPPSSVGGRRDSTGASATATDIASIPSLQVRVNVLQQRVSGTQLVQVTATRVARYSYTSSVLQLHVVHYSNTSIAIQLQTSLCVSK